MSILESIKPKSKENVRDLVARAGVDVSDWANFRSGPNPQKASVNPKYCYEWAYEEPDKVVVLNLWFTSMLEHNGVISHNLNPRQYAYGQAKNRPVVARRARSMDKLLKKAFIDTTPVRVIVIDGVRRDTNAHVSSTSKVKKRVLDPEPWTIAKYDMDNGECTVVRGIHQRQFVDQFDLDLTTDSTDASQAKMRLAKYFDRSKHVRQLALERAAGTCEWCGKKGFLTSGGSLYLETHHIISLADGGPDRPDNVVALCPNDHRQAHHGCDRELMRQKLLERLRTSTSSR